MLLKLWGKRKWAGVVLITPQGGWLLRKHSTMFEIFFDPRIEISISNYPQFYNLKVLLLLPLARKGCQSWTFSEQML
jgi:hypothetical protein